MSIPNKTSRAYSICKYLFENGPQTAEQIGEAFAHMGGYQSASKAAYLMLTRDYLVRTGTTYRNAPHVTRHLQKLDQSIFCAPAAVIVRNVFGSTMKGYEAAMRSCMRRAEIEDAPSRML